MIIVYIFKNRNNILACVDINMLGELKGEQKL